MLRIETHNASASLPVEAGHSRGATASKRLDSLARVGEEGHSVVQPEFVGVDAVTRGDEAVHMSTTCTQITSTDWVSQSSQCYSLYVTTLGGIVGNAAVECAAGYLDKLKHWCQCQRERRSTTRL